MMVVDFIVVLFFYPETKQISLEKLQENLVGVESASSAPPVLETAGSCHR